MIWILSSATPTGVLAFYDGAVIADGTPKQTRKIRASRN